MEKIDERGINIPLRQLQNVMEQYVKRDEFRAICNILLERQHNKKLPYLTAPLLILSILFIASATISLYFSYIGSQIGAAFLFPTIMSMVVLLFLLQKHKASLI